MRFPHSPRIEPGVQAAVDEGEYAQHDQLQPEVVGVAHETILKRSTQIGKVSLRAAPPRSVMT